MVLVYSAGYAEKNYKETTYVRGLYWQYFGVDTSALECVLFWGVLDAEVLNAAVPAIEVLFWGPVLRVLNSAVLAIGIGVLYAAVLNAAVLCRQ